VTNRFTYPSTRPYFPKNLRTHMRLVRWLHYQSTVFWKECQTKRWWHCDFFCTNRDLQLSSQIILSAL